MIASGVPPADRSRSTLSTGVPTLTGSSAAMPSSAPLVVRARF